MARDRRTSTHRLDASLHRANSPTTSTTIASRRLAVAARAGEGQEQRRQRAGHARARQHHQALDDPPAGGVGEDVLGLEGREADPRERGPGLEPGHIRRQAGGAQGDGGDARDHQAEGDHDQERGHADHRTTPGCFMPPLRPARPRGGFS